ncbi:MAG TPA: AI-2E family transporter [Actinoplanes sp.]|jgi:predicted PurR-regulated permease PerM|nr:AI-2E family transporter [Actinoplanes sp.]
MAADDRTAGAEPVDDARTDERAAPATMAERVPYGLVVRWAAAGTFGVLVVLLIAYAFYTVREIIVLVLIAMFAAISLDPVVRWLMKRGVRRSIAVTIVILVALTLFALFVWSIVPPIVRQSGQLFGDLPGYLARLSEESKGVREVTDRYHLTERLTALVGEIPTRLAGGAVGYAQRFAGTLASVGTVVVLTIYFMFGMPSIRSGLIRTFPDRRRARVGEIIDVVVDKVGSYMIGNIIISLFAGTAAFACLELVGVPFALPLAVAVAIADLIPMIGATLGAVVCTVVSLFTVGLWPQTVIVLVFFIVYQQVENYLLVPNVFRNTVDMPSAAVLLVALIGAGLLGLVGAIMAIPIAATVKVVWSTRKARPQEAQPSPDGSASADT